MTAWNKCTIFWTYISTHTLTWSVTLFLFLFVLCTQFQLTRSRGAWPVLYQTTEKLQGFQLTRSRGAWPLTSSPEFRHSVFQLTRSRGAWREEIASCWRTDNFNSHAHVERDLYSGFATGTNYHFNSHAHVERDAVVENGGLDRDKISTHTLTWSVTCRFLQVLTSFCISTHTLTWSVTLTSPL